MEFFIVSFILAIAAVIESKILFKCLFISIAIYFSFNVCYGYDWMNYIIVYNNSLTPGYEPFFFSEVGTFKLMQFFSWLGLSFIQFMTLCSVFIFLSIYLFCKDMKSPCFAFFAIFSFFSVYILSEWLRQAIAIGLIMIGLTLEKKGKGKVFMLLCFIASLFHIFAIMLIPYYFATKWARSNVSKFISIATISASIVIYSIYNPGTLSFIPFIGEKIASYGAILIGRQTGIFEFIMSSKLIFVYMALFITMLILKRKYKDLSLALCSVYMLFISRFSSVLIRIGFYFVPFLVMSMDDFISSKGRGMKIKLSKLICIFLIFLISTAYLWNPVFLEGAQYKLNLTSTKNDISVITANKCRIINKYYQEHTFTAQCG